VGDRVPPGAARADARLDRDRLAVLRAERGLSRKQLADKLGINYQTIGYIERGDYNPSLELALTLAELFRLPIEAIFSLKPMTPLSEEIFREPPEPR
jgi:putative transcriptional regulator